MPPFRAGQPPKPGRVHRYLAINICQLRGTSYLSFWSAIDDSKDYEVVASRHDSRPDVMVKYSGKARDWEPLKELMRDWEERGFITDPDESELPQEQIEILNLKAMNTLQG